MREIRLDGDNVPLWNQLSYPQRGKLSNWLIGLCAGAGLLLIIFPLYWMAVTAFTPSQQIFQTPAPYYPTAFTLDNFAQIFNDTQFPTWYMNSILVSVGVVSLTTITATLGGYGLTRIDFPQKRTFARTILFGYMFPAILLAIPMFIFWRQLGWINSFIGLIFADTAVSLPFSLWLMWKFFQTVPYSLEESAYMNGATRFRAFYEIALPMAKPGMVAVAVFSYAIAWNEFTIPSVLMVSSDKWVLTIGLYSFTVQNSILWGQLMAASAMTIIPSFLFVFFLQKYLLRGFRAGGIG
ncbi:carbohydrate ABC transporter permease [Salinirarus marinus]|uniref:carbohydrate ABC transporter permease n=1 Tax=Salinirarus marinus TaxID=3068310 RepID=UPI003C6C756D